MQPFSDRREAFAARLEGAAAILPAAPVALRNGDSEYEYRQDSDFYYLTGFGEPEAVLVIAPAHPTEHYVLFVRPRDRAQEIWTGRRAGVEGAVSTYGFDAAYPIAELDQRLPGYLAGASTLYYGLGADERFDRRVLGALDAARTNARRGGRAPHTLVEPGTLLHEMRVIKRPEELELMRKAAAATRTGFDAGMRITRPGLWEYQLEAAIEAGYRAEGAVQVAYTSIVAGGDNATILHYSENVAMLRDGDLVLVDSGSEYGLYATDVTRTWPVNGRFSAEQRAVYEIVLAAQRAGIREVYAGNRYDAFHDAAVRVLVDGLIDIGLLEGPAEPALESGSYR
jgi:Xaa-Pro aminopeptidase